MAKKKTTRTGRQGNILAAEEEDPAKSAVEQNPAEDVKRSLDLHLAVSS